MDDSTLRPAVPTIRRLTIERFRGLKLLVWLPEPGLNVLLGGGDVGKSTILEAIALLLTPTNTTLVVESDYWLRKSDEGFSIEAVFSLPGIANINQQPETAWPWDWEERAPTVPKLDQGEQERGRSRDPVYRLRVRGTSEFELFYEILQPNDTTSVLTSAARLSIGLVRLMGDDRNDRDIRLVHGSALDRLLSDKGLRARLGQRLAESDFETELKNDAKDTLRELDDSLNKKGLPSRLSLGLTGGPGMSINALVGLTAAKDNIQLPLTTWGAGTRRLASLEVASACQGECPITLVDEAERGLEPYRQRVLISSLQAGRSQVFLTTHSPTVISAATSASLWYIDSKGTVGALTRKNVRRYQGRQPEVFLARLAVIAEGLTEVGLVSTFLETALQCDPLQHGVVIADGEGHESTLGLLEALANTGLVFGAFADEEGKHPTRWAKVQSQLGSLLFRWPTGCSEENIIKLVPPDRLEAFIQDPREMLTGDRLRTLATRLGIDNADFGSIKAAAPDLVELIISAATGGVPNNLDTADGKRKELQKHSARWFKSSKGGRELGRKVFEFQLWPRLEPQVLPFLNAVLEAVRVPPVAGLSSGR